MEQECITAFSHGFVKVHIPNLLHFSNSHCSRGNMFKLVKTNCKTDPELFSFPNRAVTASNSLSIDIVSLITVSCFKHSLKGVNLKENCRR